MIDWALWNQARLVPGCTFKVACSRISFAAGNSASGKWPFSFIDRRCEPASRAEEISCVGAVVPGV